jgi:hypothetical protein
LSLYIYTCIYIYTVYVYITGFAVDGAVGFAVHAVGLVVVAVMVDHSCAEQNLPVHAMHMSLHSRITLILPWP